MPAKGPETVDVNSRILKPSNGPDMTTSSKLLSFLLYNTEIQMNTLKNKYFDIGANLTHSSFEGDEEIIINLANQEGVERLSVTGSNLEESIKAYELVKAFPDHLISTAGIHPHEAKQYSRSSFTEIRDLLTANGVNAIGETGLDFHRNFSSPTQQIKSFEAHIELAIDTSMPLFLHEREAHDKFIEMLKPLKNDLPKTVVHCFTGNESELQAYIDMDFYIGITGWICDERRGKHLEDLVSLIPLNKLMVETDAPYLLPRDMGIKKSSRNEPKYLPHIVNKISSHREEELEVITSSIYLNSLDFFKL